MRDDALQQNGLLIPRCDKEGRFDKVQCFSGICYCVDTNGNKIANTEKPSSEGRPDCDEPGLLFCFVFESAESKNYEDILK